MGETNIQEKETMIERTYIKQNKSLTGCRKRMLHPSLNTIVPSINSRSPPSYGYNSTRTGSRVTLTFQN